MFNRDIDFSTLRSILLGVLFLVFGSVPTVISQSYAAREPARIKSVPTTAKSACATLLNIQNSRLSTAEIKKTKDRFNQTGFQVLLAQKCNDKSLAAYLSSQDGNKTSQAVTDVKLVSGSWVGDFWITIAAGLVIPNVEVLDISPDGQIERRVLRWSDPEVFELRMADKPVAKVEDLNPLLASGRLQKSKDKRSLIVSGLKPKDVQLVSGKNKDKASYQKRMQVALLAMPDLTKPLQIMIAGDRMAIRGAGYPIHTYTRYNKADIVRAHGLILGSGMSGFRQWRCLISKFDGSNPDLAKLRSAGDFTLKIGAILEEVSKRVAQRENAIMKNQPPDIKLKIEIKALNAKLSKMRQAPEGAWFRAQIKSKKPFGCP